MYENMQGSGQEENITVDQEKKGVETDFGWSPEMVDDFTEKWKGQRGVQADVHFSGTNYEKSFDDAEATLRKFAQNRMGPITVNEREYQISEEPSPVENDDTPMAVIRGTITRLPSGKWGRKGEGSGTYYFVPNEEKGKTLGLRGAFLHQQYIIDDIRKVLSIAKEANQLVENAKYTRIDDSNLAETGAYAEKKIREIPVLPKILGDQRTEGLASRAGERAINKQIQAENQI
jgi:hypothetical protein